MARNAAYRDKLVEGAGGSALAVLVDNYLSERHCARPGSGCAFASLATDAGRKSDSIRAVFTSGLRDMVDQVSRLVPGRAARRREAALSTIAGLVGAMVLARAVDDPELRREFLAATRGSLGGHQELSPF